MSASAVSGFSTAQNMTQNLQRLSRAHQTSHSQTIQQLQVLGSKRSQASQKVVDTAIDIKQTAIGAKGRMIDVFA